MFFHFVAPRMPKVFGSNTPPFQTFLSPYYAYTICILFTVFFLIQNMFCFFPKIYPSPFTSKISSSIFCFFLPLVLRYSFPCIRLLSYIFSYLKPKYLLVTLVLIASPIFVCWIFPFSLSKRLHSNAPVKRILKLNLFSRKVSTTKTDCNCLHFAHPRHMPRFKTLRTSIFARP